MEEEKHFFVEDDILARADLEKEDDDGKENNKGSNA